MSQIPPEEPEYVPAISVLEQVEEQLKSQQERYTLTRFIDEQSKTISALGIFTALTVFSINLPHKQIVGSITHPLFVASLLIWFELIAKMPSLKKADFRLVLFIFSLLNAMLGLSLYWLLAFSTINSSYLFLIPAFLSYVWALNSIFLTPKRGYISRNESSSPEEYFEELINRDEEAKRSRRKSALLFTSFSVLCCGLYYLAQPHLTSWLDSLAKAYFSSPHY